MRTSINESIKGTAGQHQVIRVSSPTNCQLPPGLVMLREQVPATQALAETRPHDFESEEGRRVGGDAAGKAWSKPHPQPSPAARCPQLPAAVHYTSAAG